MLSRVISDRGSAEAHRHHFIRYSRSSQGSFNYPAGTCVRIGVTVASGLFLCCVDGCAQSRPIRTAFARTAPLASFLGEWSGVTPAGNSEARFFICISAFQTREVNIGPASLRRERRCASKSRISATSSPAFSCRDLGIHPPNVWPAASKSSTIPTHPQASTYRSPPLLPLKGEKKGGEVDRM